MKNRFSTLDVVAAVRDLQQYIGMRAMNIYDVNSKTYLIKLQKPEKKALIMFESGLYIITTSYDWSKSQFPSSFSMKMRKHIKQRRLESVQQVGIDRVVDLGFGDEESRVHVIVELYDRGNILLTDAEYTIINILRPRTDKDTDVKLAVRNKYPVENARSSMALPSKEDVHDAVKAAAENVQARRLLSPLVQFGGALVEHALLSCGLTKDITMSRLADNADLRTEKLMNVLFECQKVFLQLSSGPCQGFITYKTDQNAAGDLIESFIDYHPFKFAQCDPQFTKEFGSFSEAVDLFLSKMCTQKAEQRALNIEREALKKLDNVKRDHVERIEELEKSQDNLKVIAERVISNKEVVERARQVILSAIANQLSWDRIDAMCKEATRAGDTVAAAIVSIKLETNHIVMRLHDPFDDDEASIDVPIDLALNAFQNSKKLFDAKRAAAEKSEKTAASSAKALKNAEAKAKATLDSVKIRTDVSKTRKVMWFEKFLWFISRDGLIVVGGRDAQQNELLVKRYLRSGDVYVHADVRGAASVIIRNVPGGAEIPPKTLTEAAQMAVCYSNAWEAKVVASAWWVHKHQVSRTAPSGEYLTPGSFMIRGKKNFMPAAQLVMGMGIIFKLDDESVERRKMEKKLKEGDESAESAQDETQINEENEEELVEMEESDMDTDNEEEEGKEEDEFPDVQVSMAGLGTGIADEDEYTIINVGPSKPPPAVQRAEAAKREKDREERQQAEMARKEREAANKQKPLTKRQKHKMDKIKQKYGDQDEEERELRMTLLASRGKPKTQVEVVSEDKPVERPPMPERKERGEERQKKEIKEDEDEEDENEEGNEELELLDQLTGVPVAEDTLIYAVACVAPYQALADFKYKVKLMPGTGKRGKASKSAIELFLRSKTTTVREEGLLRALLTDEATARNIPGKVKVSAPQLHKK